MRNEFKNTNITMSSIKASILFILIILTFGCSKDSDSNENDIQPRYRLKNCRIEYLIFNDNIRYSSLTDLYFNTSQGQIIKTEFKYNNNKLSHVNGGFFNNYLAGLVFTDSIYDSIVNNGNITDVYTKPQYFHGFFGNYYKNDSISYVVNNSNRLSRITLINGANLTYNYSVDTIKEIDSMGEVIRTFYFKNKNLVKVEEILGDKTSGNYYFVEYQFNNYDSKPNPFKGMYFMEGAFFRSLSENNYLDFSKTISYYDHGIFAGIFKSYNFKMPFTYNSLGYPNFGEYEEY